VKAVAKVSLLQDGAVTMAEDMLTSIVAVVA
jgi:hypothetical protein